MRKRTLNKIISKSPVPVIWENNYSFPRGVFYGKDFKQITLSDPKGLASQCATPPVIILGTNQPTHIKLFVYYHELGHALFCQRYKSTHCYTTEQLTTEEVREVWKLWGVANELAAYRFCLKMLLKYKYASSLKEAMKNIQESAVQKPFLIKPGLEYGGHLEAAQQILQEPIWAKCKEFLKKKHIRDTDIKLNVGDDVPLKFGDNHAVIIKGIERQGSQNESGRQKG